MRRERWETRMRRTPPGRPASHIWRSRTAACALLIVVGVLGSAGSGSVHAQNRAPHQMRPEHDLLSYGVVETLPGMDRVRVVSDVTYKTVDGTVLQMDLTYPPDAPKGSKARPAVVFVNGVGDWPGQRKLRTWGQYRSWPRLVAASGLIGVAFDARSGDESRTADDVRDAFAFLREKGPEMGIDVSRIAAWACSANVRTAVALLMPAGGPEVKSAVLYYGAAETPSIRA